MLYFLLYFVFKELISKRLIRNLTAEGQRHRRDMSGEKRQLTWVVEIVYGNFYYQGYILLVLAQRSDLLLLPSCTIHGKARNVDTSKTLFGRINNIIIIYLQLFVQMSSSQ